MWGISVKPWKHDNGYTNYLNTWDNYLRWVIGLDAHVPHGGGNRIWNERTFWIFQNKAGSSKTNLTTVWHVFPTGFTHRRSQSSSTDIWPDNFKQVQHAKQTITTPLCLLPGSFSVHWPVVLVPVQWHIGGNCTEWGKTDKEYSLAFLLHLLLSTVCLFKNRFD